MDDIIRPNWALILCGGKGERLRPLTDEVPKPMVPVAGTPILERQVKWLLSYGIFNIMFLTGYRGDVIKNHFKDGTGKGFTAHYSHEDKPLGRGGAIRKGLITIRDMGHRPENVVVMNGDNLTNVNLNRMFKYHIERRFVGTVLLAPYESQYGLVQVNAGVITDFNEKGIIPGLYVNTGIYIFNKQMRVLLPQEGDHEKTTFPHLANQRSLGAELLMPREYWHTMDSVADIQRVERQLHP